MSNEKPTYPSRLAEQFVVRFPDGMRDRLKEAAHANGRSMNAEIVARLQQSLDAPADVVELRQELDRLKSTDPLYRLYLLIDSHGYPQSWAEIHELISAVSAAGKLNAVEIQAHVVTPDMESNSRRGKEAADLARRLRAEGKSRLIDNPDVIAAVRAAITAAADASAATDDAARASGGDIPQRRIRVRRPEQP